LGLEKRLSANEPNSIKDYTNLCLVISSLDTDLFTKPQLEDIDIEIGDLLVSQNLIHRSMVTDEVTGETEPIGRFEASSNRTTSSRGSKMPKTVVRCEARFLEDCREWWMLRYEAKQEALPR
jgi:hypothetical protein